MSATQLNTNTHSGAKEVLVYDPSVSQVDVLLNGLESGVKPQAVSAHDALAQIKQVLQQPGMKKLHLLGHGAPGEIILGGQRIDAQSFKDMCVNQRNTVNPEFEIAFWSCKTGHGDIGMNFLNTVANATGANVYASSGLVGHEDKGGSWVLDVKAAPRAPFSSQAQEEFLQVLIAPTIQNSTPDGVIYTENSSPVELFGGGTVFTGNLKNEGTQRIKEFQFLVRGVSDGSSELIVFDGVSIALTPFVGQKTVSADYVFPVDAQPGTTWVYSVQSSEDGALSVVITAAEFVWNSDVDPTLEDLADSANYSTTSAFANFGSMSLSTNPIFKGVTYQNLSEDPTVVDGVDRVFEVKVLDSGNETSAATSFLVNISPLNDVPVVTAGATLAYTENAAAAAIGSVSLTDLDDTNIAGATVSISSATFVAGDVLSFTNTSDISGTYNAATGTLTLTGTASKAAYEAALSAVKFSSTSDDPTDNGAKTSRSISYTVTDANSDGAGAQTSLSATATVNVTASNDVPVVTAGATLAYTENAAAAAIGSVSLTDLDDTNIAGATVSISSATFVAGDVLSFTNTSDISGTYNAATGTLTLTGTASKAAYEAALSAVKFSSTSDDPTDNGAKTSRSISYTVTDANSDGAGAQTSLSATATVNVTASNDVPVVTAGATLAYTENAAAAAIGSVSLTDLDDTNIAGATVSISSATFVAGDVLSFTNTSDISGTYNAATGTLTLTGTASKAAYEAALSAVKFSSTSDDPTDNGAKTSRSISYTVTDANSDGAGAQTSLSATATVNVTASNDVPVVTAGATLAYTENAAAAAIGSVSLTDLDDTNIAGATVSISSATFVAGDVLSFTNTSDISGTYNAATGTLTLTGTASKAAYEAALSAVKFSSTSDDPTDNGAKTSRSISYTVTDANSDGAGAQTSLSATATLDITALNDAPEVVVVASALTEDAVGLVEGAVAATFTTSDVESDARVVTFAEGSNDDGYYVLGTDADANKVLLTAAGAARVNAGNTLPAISLVVTETDTATPMTGSYSDTPVVNLVNDAPVRASAATLTAIAEDSGPRTITQAQLLAGVTDQENDGLTASNLQIAGGGYGEVVDNENGTWTYTPALNDDTSVTFSYTVTDDGASPRTLSATATLDITALNDAPEVVVVASALTEDAVGLVEGAVAATFTTSDVESDARVVTFAEGSNDDGYYVLGTDADANKVLLTAAGAARVNAGNTLPAISLVVTETDTATPMTGSYSDTPVVNLVNDAPVRASAATLTAIAEDSGPRTITQAQLLAGVTDQENDGLTASNLQIAGGGYGEVVDNENGTWTYTPALNDDTSVTFSYTVTDDGASPRTLSATATLDITALNDAPEVVVVASALTEDAVGLVEGAVAATFTTSDVESDARVVTFAEGSNDDGYYVLGTDADANKVLLTAAGAARVNAGNTLPAISLVVTETDTATPMTGSYSDTPVVNLVNDAPVRASAATLTAIAEDSGPRTITQAQLLAGVTDQENDGLTASNLQIAGGGYGEVVDNENGTWTYTPALNDDTSVTFSYTVTDDGASPRTLSATATLDITALNDAPEVVVVASALTEDAVGLVEGAVAATFTTSDVESDARVVTFAEGSNDDGYYVLGTDADANKVLLTAAGAARVNAGNTLPAISLVVTETDTATPMTGSYSDTPVVNLVNDAPVRASAATLTAIAEDSGPRTITQAQLLAGVTDQENDGLTASNLQIAGGGYGEVVDNENGTWTYTPALNDDTSVTFSYTVTDDGASPRTLSATATLDITALNDAPEVVVVASALTEDAVGLVEGAVAATFTTSDVESDARVVTFAEGSNDDGYYVLGTDADANKVLLTAAGAARVNAGNTLPAISLVVTETDTATPMTGSYSDTPVVNLVNDAPVRASAATLTAIAEDSGPRTITQAQLLAGVTDQENDGLTASNLQIAGGGYGEVVDNENGTWTYTPALNDDTSVTFSYTVTDDGASPRTLSATATLDITALNDAPEVVVVASALTEDAVGLVEGAVAATFTTSDVESDARVVTFAEGSNDDGYYVLGTDADANKVLLTAAGAARVNAGNTLPAISLVVTETDTATPMTGSYSDTPVVNLVNDAPVRASAATLTAIAEDSGPRTITQAQLLAGVTDQENDGLTASNLQIAGGGYGEVVDNENGTWTYTPALNDDTSVTFSYTVTDDGASPRTLSATATLDITALNDAPEVVVVASALTEDAVGLVEGAVAATFTTSDVESDARVVTFAEGSNDDGYYVLGTDADANKVLLTAAGAARVNAGNTLPAISLVVTETDTATPMTGSYSDTPVVNLVNDAPVRASAATLTAIAEDSGPRTITQAQLLAGVTDQENDGLTASNLQIAGGGYGEVVDNENGTWTYTPALNDDTSVTFSYTVTDDGASPRTLSATATLDITALNDAPEVVSDNNFVGHILKGATFKLAGEDIDFFDPENPARDEVTYSISNIAYGSFAVGGELNVTEFTAQQVHDGLVIFVHDGSENVPSFTIRVSDGIDDGAVAQEFTFELGTINISLASESNQYGDDPVFYSKDNRPELTVQLNGRVEVGDWIYVYDGLSDTRIAQHEITVNDQLDFFAASVSVNIPLGSDVDLSDGLYGLTATVSKGNVESSPSSTFDLLIDTVPPLGVGNVVVETDVLGYLNPTDSERGFDITGLGEPGSYVYVQLYTSEENPLFTFDAEPVQVGIDGVWSLTIASTDIDSLGLQAELIYSVSVKDAAGNEQQIFDEEGNYTSIAPLTGTLIVDMIPPEAPTLGLLEVSDTGANSNDGLTKSVTPILSGQGEPGALVNIFIRGDGGEDTLIGTTTVGEDGNYELAVSLAELSIRSYMPANSPESESVEGAFDSNSDSKYLNFDKFNTGAIVGLSELAIINSIAFTTADDEPGRDPLNFSLYGSSTSDGTYSLIVSNQAIGLSDMRGDTREVVFDNSDAYQYFKLVFPTVKDPANVNSMQIADIIFKSEGQPMLVDAVQGVTFGTIEDGTATFVAELVDAAGNKSTVQTFDMTLDTNADAPVVSVEDSNSNNKTPTVTVALAADVSEGDLVQVYYDSSVVGSSVLTAQDVTAGEVSITVDDLFDIEGDGVYTLGATVTDEAGNESLLASVDYTLDTNADAPVVSVEDSNSNNKTPTVTVALAADVSEGDLVQVYYDSSVVGSSVLTAQDVTAGEVSITVDDLFDIEGDGVYTLGATVTDEAGNESLLASVDYTLDTNADAPVVSVEDSNSNNKTPTVTVALAADVSEGDLVQVYYDSSVVGSSVLTAQDVTAGEVSITVDDLFDIEGDGVYTLGATVTDEAGNESLLASVDYTLDTNADAPVVSVEDSNSNNKTPTVTVALAADVSEGDLVQVYYDSSVVGSSVLTAQDVTAGEVSITVDDLFDIEGDGVYTLGATVTDEAGNESLLASVDYTLDTNADAPVVSVEDSNSNNKTPTVTVALAADVSEGDLVQVYYDSSVVGSSVLTAQDVTAGEVSITVDDLFDIEGDGVYTLGATVTDEAGNESLLASVDYTLDTNADAPVVSVEDSNSNNKTPTVTVALAADVSEGDLVQVYYDSSVVGSSVLTAQDVTAGEVSITVDDLFDIEGDGVYTLGATVTDEAGNESLLASVDYTLDTNADAPVVSVEDSNSNNKTPTVTVALAADVSEGDLVQVYYDSSVVGSSVLTAQDVTAGEVSITVDDLFDIEGDGVYTLGATVTDEAGNESLLASVDYTLDTNADAPVVSVEDSNSNNKTPTVTVALAADVSEGDLVQVYYDSSVVGSSVLTAQDVTAGEVSITVDDLFDIEGDGVYTLGATVTDEAGNESLLASVDYTLDTNADAPVVSVEDSNSNNKTPTVTVALAADVSEGDLVQVYYDSSVVGSSVLTAQDVTAGEVSITVDDLFDIEGDGVYTLGATVTDEAGNESLLASVDYTLDTNADAPVVSVEDSNSNNKTPTVTVALAADVSEGDLVQVYYDSSVVGSSVLTAQDVTAGEVSITVDDLFDIEGDGVYTLGATVTDEAGNESLLASVDYTLDTNADAPVVSVEDSNSNNKTPTVTVALAADVSEGDLVQVYYDSSVVGSSVLTAQDVTAGEVSITVDDLFDIEGDGVYTLGATVTDEAGNESLLASVDYTLDTNADAPVVSVEDSNSNNKTPTVTVALAADVSEGDLVQVYYDSSVVGSSVLTAQDVTAGEVSITVDDLFDIEGDGVYTLGATVTDEAGNESLLASVDYTLDTNADAPVVSVEDSNSNNKTPTVTVALAADVSEGDLVQVYYDSSVVGSSVLTAQDVTAGEVSITVDDLFDIEGDGVYTLGATVTDEAGNESLLASVDYTLDTNADAPVVSVEDSNSNNKTPTVTVALAADVSEGDLVQVYYDSSVVGSSVLTAQDVTAGEVSITVDDLFDIEGDGVYTLGATVTDEAGNESLLASVDYTLDTNADAPVVSVEDSNSNNKTPTVTVALAADVSEGDLVQVYYDSSVVGSSVLTAQDVTAGEVSITVDDLFDIEGDGVYTLGATVTDEAGNESLLASVDYTLDTNADAPVVSVEDSNSNNKTPTVTVALAADVSEGDLVQVYYDSSVVGSSVLTAQDVTAGEVSITVDDLFDIEGDGVYTLGATVTDEAGNESLLASVDYTLDTNADAPVVSVEDSNSNNKTPTVTVALAADVSEGDLVQVYYDSSVVGSSVLTAQDVTAGEVSITVDDLFDIEGDGVYTLGATVTDEAGNESLLASVDYTLDTNADAPVLSLFDDTGRSPTDHITSSPTVEVRLSEDVATWSYSTDGGSTWTDGVGNSFQLNVNAIYDIGDVQVRQTDEAGNTSEVVTNDVVWSIDNTRPEAGTSVASAQGSQISSGVKVVNVYKVGDVIQGYWNQGSASDFDGGVKFNFSQFGGGDIAATNNGRGLWSARYTLTDGSLQAAGLTSGSVDVIISDLAGNETTITAPQIIAFDTNRPDILSIDGSALTSGILDVGESVHLSLVVTENMPANSTLVVTLSTGGDGTQITLTRDTTDLRLFKGTYTVGAGDTTSDLTVISVAPGQGGLAPHDASGNALTLTLPIDDNLADNAAIDVRTNAPDISVQIDDVSSASLGESNSGLSVSGTLTLRDVDVADSVDVQILNTDQVVVSGTAASSSTLSQSALKAMLTLNNASQNAAASDAVNNLGWTFNSNGEAFNFLDVGETLVLNYLLTATDSSANGAGGAGKTDTQWVTITVTGTNDLATLTSDTKALTETNTVLSTGGQLVLSDLDATDATVVAQTATAGNYGTFAINAAGEWTYATTNELNQLNHGQVVTETFTVATTDGGSAAVTVTITGSQDVATLTSDTKALTETNTVLSTGGQLVLSDLDATDATVVAQTATAGNYGTFAINAAGEWTYATTNALNQLNHGQVVTETFTVATTDGGSAAVTVTITGSQDVATLTSDTKALTETNTVLSTGGQLVLSDLDATDATVVAQTATAGNYGTFAINAAGEWTYATTNALNQLNHGQVVTETFTVATTDGGSAAVTVTITGSQDVATLTSDTKALTETNTVLSTGGQLVLSDLDATDATVVAQTATAGNYGTFAINAAGEWTYATTNELNQLNHGQVVTETFTVATTDGGSAAVTVTITGSQDVATLTSDTKALTETNTVLSTGGQLVLSDLDATDATVVAQTATAGNYGTFAINAAGEWTYATTNALNQLNHGQVVTETFTVATTDGGSADVTVTITGTMDTPTVALASDSFGADGTDEDLLTNDAELTFSVPAADVTREFQVDDGEWTSDYIAPTVDGEYTVSVRDTDTAGNVETQRITFTLDTTLATPTVALASDSFGADGTDEDLLTNDAELTFSVPAADVTREFQVDDGEWTSDYIAPTVDGEYTVSVRDTDTAGNVETQRITFTLDTTLATPTVALASDSFGADGTDEDLLTNDAELTFSVPAADVTREFQVDDGEWTSDYIAPTVDGEYTVSVRDTDTAGNVETQRITFTLDTTLATPTVALASDSFGADGTDEDLLTNDAELTFSVPAADVTREFQVDDGEWTSDYIAPTVDGEYTVSVRDTDTAGNVETQRITFTLDTTLATPTVALASDSFGADGTDEDLLTNDAELTFSVPAADVTREFQVDDGEWTSDYIAPTVDGEYTVSVRDTDTAGNVETQRITFTLDTTLATPTVALASDSFGADGTDEDLLTNDAELTFSVPAADVTREFQVDDGEWTSDYIAPTVDGEYTVSVRDTDTAGNVETQRITFTLDTTLATPTVALASDSFGADGTDEDLLTNDAELTFSVPAADVTREFQVDDGEWTSDYIAPTVDGEYTVSVRDTDTAGNVETQRITFTLDTTLATPTVALASDSFGADGTDEDLLTNDAELTFSVPAADVTREFQVDDGEWTSDYIAPTVDGEYTVSVRDTDTAGNVETQRITFTLDTTLATPTVALASDSFGADGTDEDLLTNDAELTFSVPAADVTREFQVDDGEWTSDYIAPTVDGEYTVSVRDTDTAGNVETQRITFTLDTTLATPTVALASDSFGADGTDEDLLTNDAELTFSVPAADVTREFQVDDGEWTSDYIAPTVDGEYTVSVRDTDTAGNVETQRITFTLDTTLATPTVALASDSFGADGTDEDLLTNDAELTFSVPAADVTREFQVDDGEWTSDYIAPTVDGEYTVSVRDTDTAGNVETQRITFTLDTTLATPTVALASDSFGADGTDEDLLTNDAELTFSVPAADVTREFQVDDGEWTSDYIAPTVDGEYTVSVRDTDTAGNVETQRITFTLDTTLATPTVALASDSFGADGTDEDLLTNDAELTFSVPAADVTREFQVDDGEWTSDYIAPTVDGEYTVSVRDTDTAGNVETQRITFTLDTTLATPTVALASDSFGADGTDEDLLTNDAELTFSVPAADVTREFQVDDGEWTSDYIAPTVDGEYTVSVRDTDTAGNVETQRITFTLDTTLATPTGALDVVSENGALAIGGGYAIDGITNDSTPTLSGTAEAGSQVSVSIPSLAAPITTTADVNGHWVITATTLANGLYTATVNVTDKAGNTASASSASFTIDTAAATLRAPVGNLQTFYNARLLSDGHTVELYFNEQLLTGNEAAIESQLSVKVAGYTVGVAAGSLVIGHSDDADAIDYRKVTFQLDKDVTAGLTIKINYVDPTTGDQTTGVIQDIAGNDVVSSLWSSRNGSTVTDLTDATNAIKVFAEGMVGGTEDDDLSYTKETSEFLVGGAGSDTVTIDVADVVDNESAWYVAAYSGANLPEGVIADTSQTLYGFTKVNTPAKSVYVQAETINLGDSSTGTHFTVDNNVLQIADQTGRTVKIDVDVIDPTTSIVVGSGAGSDRIEDVTDFLLRSDTVVYTSGVSSASTGVMETKAALLAGIENILYVGTNDNELQVSLPGVSDGSSVTDTLIGIERLTFKTADGQSSDVALVGTTSSASDHQGLNGYGSLTDAAAGATPAAVIFVVDDVLKNLDRASLVTTLDGMFKTDGDNNLSFSLTPKVDDSWVSFEGTSKVVFQAKNGGMVTVHVVGADGYATIDAAMADAHAGDVIYITDNALNTAITYQVFKENITFLAYTSTYNDQLKLVLGDIQTADHSLEIKNLFLMGDAKINVDGNQYDNHIVGNRGKNIIQGGDGNDVIDTAGGADRIYGGLGNDTLIASSASDDFPEDTVLTPILLNGGAGNDLLVAATTDWHKVNMTGGAGADVFKFAGVSKDNGALKLDATILDLSARSGDDLDFTQILKAGAHVTSASDLSASYSGGNLNYNFASASNYSTSASDTTSAGAEVLSTVGLTGSVQVYMTTTSNVASALVLATPAVTDGTVTTPPNNGTTVHQDIFGGTVTDEMLKLMPMFDHNTLG